MYISIVYEYVCPMHLSHKSTILTMPHRRTWTCANGMMSSHPGKTPMMKPTLKVFNNAATMHRHFSNIKYCSNRMFQVKCMASVTSCSLRLAIAMDGNFSLMVNTGNLSINYFILYGDWEYYFSWTIVSFQRI